MSSPTTTATSTTPETRPVLSGAPRAIGAALGIVLVIGTALRLYYALVEPMRYDEAYTFNEYASPSLYDALSLYTFPNNHIFHSALVHLSIRAFGDRPWAVRLPALAAGLLLMPATYFLVRRLSDRGAAVLATALVASSTMLISYSANARGYSLICLFMVWLALLADRIAESNQLRDWAALTLLTPLGFLTVPTMLYPYGGVVLWSLITSWTRSDRRAIRLDRLVVSGLISGVLTLVLYLPALGRSGVKALVANPFVAPHPPSQIDQDLIDLAGRIWDEWTLDIPKAVVVALILVWVVSLAARAIGKVGSLAPSALALIVFTSSFAAMRAQRVVPPGRVLLFMLPLFFGAIASGLSATLALATRLDPRGTERACAGLAVLLCAGLSACVVARGSIRKETEQLTLCHADAILDRLKPILGPEDAILAAPPTDAPLKYYCLLHGIPTRQLLDYHVARARRLFVVVNRPSGQTAESVLGAWKIDPKVLGSRQPLSDFGLSAVYDVRRQ